MWSSKKVEQFSCVYLNGRRRFGWQRSDFLLYIMGAFMSAAILLPYFTVIARKILPEFLPFISQSGGSPPQTGLLSIFLIFTAFTGLMLFPTFFESINHRNRLNSKWIRRINYLGLVIAIGIGLGCIVTASFPVGNTGVPNQLEWLVTVLLEHGFGASLVLCGIVIYQFLLTVMWWLLPDVTRISKFIKVAFCVIYLICFAIVAKPLVDFIYEELGSEPFNFDILRNVTSYELPVVFSTNYKISAFLEWAMCFLTLLNFLASYKDFKRISFHVAVLHKSCIMEIQEPAPVLSLKSLS